MFIIELFRGVRIENLSFKIAGINFGVLEIYILEGQILGLDT